MVEHLVLLAEPVSGEAVEVEDATVDDLALRFRRVFPDFGYAIARLKDHGGDHRLLTFDDTFAICFPQAATHYLDRSR